MTKLLAIDETGTSSRLQPGSATKIDRCIDWPTSLLKT